MAKICDNCKSYSNKSNDKILSTWDMRNGSTTHEIDISTALSVIFEQNPLTSKSKIRPSIVDIHGAVFNKERLHFCTMCSTKLTSVYNAFVELIQLCALQSKVAGKVRQIDQLLRKCSHVEINGESGSCSKRRISTAKSSRLGRKRVRFEQDETSKEEVETDNLEHLKTDYGVDNENIDQNVDVKVKIEVDDEDFTFNEFDHFEDPELYDDGLDGLISNDNEHDYNIGELLDDIPTSSTSYEKTRPQRRSAVSALENFAAESDNEESDDENLEFSGNLQNNDDDDGDEDGSQSESEDYSSDSDSDYGRRSKRIAKGGSRSRKVAETRSSEHYCTDCSKNFSNRSGLNRHNRQFHGDVDGNIVMFDCPYCQKEFKRSDDLLKHKRKFHGETKPPQRDTERKCKICKTEFRKPNLLRRHLASVHVVRSDRLVIDEYKVNSITGNLQCELCDKEFLRPGALRRHLELHDGNVTHACPFEECGKTFARRDYVRGHLKAMHGGEKAEEYYTTKNHSVEILTEKLPCEICGKIFTNPRTLRNHLQLHSGKKFECPFEDCNKAFPRRDYVRDHLRSIHGGERLEETYLCRTETEEETVKNKAELTVAVDKQRLDCDICGKVFGYYQSLRRHKEGVHTENEGIRCPFETCQKIFKRREYVRDHLRFMHAGQKVDEFYINGSSARRNGPRRSRLQRIRRKYNYARLNCEQCGASIRKNRMKEHLVTHTGEKPHLCEVCGKSFSFASGLKVHKMGVHGINAKRYSCTICPAVFSRSSLLRNHIKGRHENLDRVYMCEQCGKGFRYEKSLREHMDFHVNPSKYTCQQCGKVCSRVSNLNEHIKNQHMNIKNPYSKYHLNPNRVIKKRNRIGSPFNKNKPSTSTSQHRQQQQPQELGNPSDDNKEQIQDLLFL